MPGFGVASVFGALLGAFAAALAMGRFRLATFSDTGDTLRNLLGAALMGVGGVMALGCTVGQAHHRRLHAGARLVPDLRRHRRRRLLRACALLERQIMALTVRPCTQWHAGSR